MSERLQIPIPMWRVQYQLQGGHRRVWLIAGIVMILEIIAAVALRRVIPRESLEEVMQIILYGLAVFQIGLLYLGGSNAIYRAMLRDYESKMVESHRLTPMSNVGVALGYLLGPTILVMVLYLVTMLFGMFVTALAKGDLGDWLLGHAVLVFGAMSVWSLVVFWDMRQGKPFSPAPIIIGLSAFGMPIAMHPGAGAIFGIYASAIGWAALTGDGAPGVVAAIVLAVVGVIATTFWIGVAAVRFRRPDLPALNGWRGLLMLSLWLILSVIGLAANSLMAQTTGVIGQDSALMLIRWIATILVSIVIGAGVTMATANCAILVGQGRMPRGSADRIHETIVALASAILIVLTLYFMGWSVWRNLPDVDSLTTPASGIFNGPWTPTAIACGTSLVTAGAFYRLAAARLKLKSPFAASALVLLLLTALPPILDTIRSELFRVAPNPPKFSMLFGCSPAGSIIAAWSPVSVPIEAGILIQVVFMVLCLFATRVRVQSPNRLALSSS